MTTLTMARKRQPRRGDAVNGMLLLDKPAGITSNAALQEAKTLLGARKGGHTGSLDPIATGLLPLCFGHSTKLSSFFLGAEKIYWAQIRLGQTTDTGDSEGQVVATSALKPSRDQIEMELAQFRGELEQVPPMYSAIKVKGKPLYRLAREGITIEREARRFLIVYLELTEYAFPFVEIKLRCSHGFYVRGLADDLGTALGCGGHVSALRRLGVADLTVDEAMTMDQLSSLADQTARRKSLVPADQGLCHIPEVRLSVDAAYYLCRGQAVRAAGLPKHGDVIIYSTEAGFLGVGQVTDDGRVAPRRLMVG